MSSSNCFVTLEETRSYPAPSQLSFCPPVHDACHSCRVHPQGYFRLPVGRGRGVPCSKYSLPIRRSRSYVSFGRLACILWKVCSASTGRSRDAEPVDKIALGDPVVMAQLEKHTELIRHNSSRHGGGRVLGWRCCLTLMVLVI